MNFDESVPLAKASIDARQAKYARRKFTNIIALILSLAAMAFGLVWLFWILFETVRLGLAGLTWATLTQMTPPPNDAGGLANAIYGSFLMVMLATFVGTPIGVMAGIYLAEFDTHSWLAAVTRFVNDILLSVFGRGRAVQVVFWLCRYSGFGTDRDPGGDSNHRKHAATDTSGAA